MASKQDSHDFWRNDPILEILKGRFNLSSTKIILIAVLFTAVCHFLLGSIASNIYTGTGRTLTHLPYLYFQLAWLLVFTPIIWLFYLWQPDAADKVVDSLEENNMIGCLIKENNPPKAVQSLSDFRKKFAPLHKKWYVVALLPVVLFWIYGYYFAWPEEFRQAGAPPFWFTVKWFTPLFILGYSITFYVLWIFVVRHLQIIHFFNRLFYFFDIQVKPVCPDEAGGLGVIGEFTARAGMIAIGIGVIAVAYGFYIWATTGNPFRPDVITLFAIYIVATPLSLILPMLGAHQVMKKARSKNLEEVSQEFSRILSNLNTTITADVEVIKKTNEKLSELKQTYQHIYDAFPVWPISFRLARNFSITATLPLLSGLISVVIQYVTS